MSEQNTTCRIIELRVFFFFLEEEEEEEEEMEEILS